MSRMMAPIGDELSFAYGNSLPSHVRQPGKIPVFGSNGQVGWHSEVGITGPGIIVGRKGSVGEVKFSTSDYWPIDTTYYVVNPKAHNWRYLFYLLKHADLTGLNSHSAVPGLNREDAYAIQAWFPDAETQEKIANALDNMTSCLALEKHAIISAQRIKQATMHELFTCGLRGEVQKETEIGLMPESWDVDRLGAHHSVVSGGTPSRSNPAFWSGGTIPWTKTTEVNYCVISQTEEHITPEGLSGSAAKLLPAGTLLLAMYGQGVTRGRVAILGIEAACNQACAAITPKDNAVVTKYLYHFLTWRYEAIRELAHGGQQQNLNLDIVRDLQIAYPTDPDEQQEIIEILDAIDQKIALHQQKESVLDELFRSLLHKLMTGEVSVEDLDLSALTTEEPQPKTGAEVQS